MFAPIFIVLQLFFFFFACFPALLVLFASLVYLCYLCGSLGVLLGFLFPLRTIRKERARRVGASSLVPLWACLDVLKHYRQFLRFIVPISNPFTGDSCNIFGLVCWVVYYLPVFVNS